MHLSRLTGALACVVLFAAANAAYAAPGKTVESGTPAAKCTGNACASLLFEISAGCFNATNLGGKQVLIEWGGYELKVGAGQTKSVKKDGRCVHDVAGPLSANYG
ncbi:MAG TPA: hypothetical protein VGL66_07275 [Caulobacteraceae bacterium]|jgi:hypothetical protein